MIAIAGGTRRLRPHVKTHKMAEVVRLQMALGITKFKCATIAEAEMVADCGVLDVLLAYQPVGPGMVASAHSASSKMLSAHQLLHHRGRRGCASRALSDAAVKAGAKIKVLLDIDCGMHRSGVPAGPKAMELYHLIASLPGLEPNGFHIYDGNIEDTDLALRTKRCDDAFAPVAALRSELSGLPVPHIVAGGSPTFAIHARRPDVECSPGTCVLWDTAYGDVLPDLDFLHAAVVLTRVVSKPGGNRLCLDLGHKAIAAEKPQPRVTFLNLPDAQPITHSEEHLVVETSRANEISVGDCFYGIPKHVCPTVALHAEAVVIKNGQAEARWKVAARARMLSI